jgi:DNA primase
MIAIACSVIVIAGVLFEFIRHRPFQLQRHLKGVINSYPIIW